MKEVETIITCEITVIEQYEDGELDGVDFEGAKAMIAAAERARIRRMIGETHNNRYVSPPKVQVFVREV
jgi:hypothetical protein